MGHFWIWGLLINGWKGDDGSEDLCPFRQRKEELSLKDDCVLWSSRVVIPKPGQRLRTPLRASRDFKNEEPGSQLCLVAKLDADFEEKAKSCQVCQLHQKAPAQAPGSGLNNHGLEYMQTMLDCSKGKCSCY